MKLKFEQLSDILLEDIFKLLHPRELFNLRFLSKYLHLIVSRTIKYNLTYSVYNKFEYNKYWSYQKKFINENGILMKHLNICDETIEYLNSCPNIISINCRHIFDDTKVELNVELTNLKKITIDSRRYSRSLNLFYKYLKHIELFEVIGYDISIENIIEYLNLGKLKSFKVYSYNNLNIDGLDIIKTRCSELKLVSIKSNEYISTSSDLNSKIDFNSNLKLEIAGKFTPTFNIKHFGDLKRLNSVKFIDFHGLYFDINNEYDSIELLENSNIVALGYLNPNYVINCAFLKLSSLREVYIANLSKELLISISQLSTIQTVHFGHLNSNIEKVFSNSYLKGNDAHKEYNSIKCKFVKQIKVETLYTTFAMFLYLLSFFPNLGMFKVETFNLTNVHVRIDYEPTTPLLFIAPVALYMDRALFDELENDPMLDWIKL
ncbi:hypothetical protein K502DRAFT_327374 [Neoconidiobolus thromboides FSU 785]|nr:hypothetical protein K502DRAFT_327374 [Neoconidiobolus thromboides FSU 785]